MKKVVTFGEIMLRLNPEGYQRFVQAECFEASYAGAEANVAVSLAGFGLPVEFVTKVPSHEIGQAAINRIRTYGVGTEGILRGGKRIGVYFVEKGASQRASKVIYDRAGSAIALSGREEYDWDHIFADAGWFHFSGITPALGGELPMICLDACRAAKEMGVTVSCDLNYRKNLWSREAARECMEKLMQYVDVCIANEEDAKDVFGIEAKNTDIDAGRLDRDGYVVVARQLCERFNFRYAAITLRESLSASDNNWSGMLYGNGEGYFSKKYQIHIVDRVGGGDSFSAGLIYALLMDKPPREAIEFAAAASCLKHSIEHDFNLISVQEAETLAQGNGSGRVQR